MCLWLQAVTKSWIAFDNHLFTFIAVEFSATVKGIKRDMKTHDTNVFGTMRKSECMTELMTREFSETFVE